MKTANERVKSFQTVGPGYRRAEVDGRRFWMTRSTYRGGHKGARYTVVCWTVIERNSDDTYKCTITDKAHTIAQAEKAIARATAMQADDVSRAEYAEEEQARAGR